MHYKCRHQHWSPALDTLPSLSILPQRSSQHIDMGVVPQNLEVPASGCTPVLALELPQITPLYTCGLASTAALTCSAGEGLHVSLLTCIFVAP